MFVAVPLLVFVALAALVRADPKPDLDERLLMFLNGSVEGSALGDAAELLTVACLWAGAIILLAVLGALSVRRRFASAVFLGSVIVGSLVLERALKHVIERAAINQEEAYSFPSGSATVSLAVVVARLSSPGIAVAGGICGGRGGRGRVRALDRQPGLALSN